MICEEELVSDFTASLPESDPYQAQRRLNIPNRDKTIIIQETNIPAEDQTMSVFRPHLSIISKAAQVATTLMPPIRVVPTRGFSMTPWKKMPE
jgi:hypothetical protein